MNLKKGDKNMLHILKNILGMTFGGNDAIDMVRNDPDLTKREATVGINFLKSTGVEITIIPDLEEKQTSLQNAITSSEQGIAIATARLEEIPNKLEQKVLGLKDITKKEIGRISKNAKNQKKLVNDNANHRIENFVKKINHIKNQVSIRKSIIDGRAKETMEEVIVAQKKTIDTITDQFNQELKSTKKILASLQFSLELASTNLAKATEVKKLFS